jgi:hypothetical protein
MDKSMCWKCGHVNVCIVFPQILKLNGNQGNAFVVRVEVTECTQYKKAGDE